MMICIDETRLYNKRIVSVVEGAKKHILDWEKATGRNLHEWLPWRTLVTIVIFFLFLKSFRATAISFPVVLIGVVSPLVLTMCGYGITILSSLIAPHYCNWCAELHLFD